MIRVEVRCKKHPHYMGRELPADVKGSVGYCAGCYVVWNLATYVAETKQVHGSDIMVMLNDKAVH